jgi:ribonuclease HII
MSVTLELEHELWAAGIERIAGLDEAGRGPLAGPVVAAAVILPRGVELPGVDDSKKLSPHRRERLFDAICSQALAFGIGMADHETIDRINILQASILAMHRAVEALRVPAEFLLVDGNAFSHERLPFRTVIGGDGRSLSIAAASILAKVTRDRLMTEYDAEYPGYGFAQHKGYGTPQHLEAIRQRGTCPIHRRSFHIHASPR